MEPKTGLHYYNDLEQRSLMELAKAAKNVVGRIGWLFPKRKMQQVGKLFTLMLLTERIAQLPEHGLSLYFSINLAKLIL